jgi:hypothetical protein
MEVSDLCPKSASSKRVAAGSKLLYRLDLVTPYAILAKTSRQQ